MSKKKKTATEELDIEEKIAKIKKAEEEWKENDGKSDENNVVECCGNQCS